MSEMDTQQLMVFSTVCCIFSFSQSGCKSCWVPSRVRVLARRLPVLVATITPGTQQRAGKTRSKQRSFAGAEIPFFYQALPGKRGRRRAKWNTTNLQRHVGARQPQPALAAPAPGCPPRHRTQLPALGRVGQSVAAASLARKCQSVCQA